MYVCGWANTAAAELYIFYRSWFRSYPSPGVIVGSVVAVGRVYVISTTVLSTVSLRATHGWLEEPGILLDMIFLSFKTAYPSLKARYGNNHTYLSIVSKTRSSQTPHIRPTDSNSTLHYFITPRQKHARASSLVAELEPLDVFGLEEHEGHSLLLHIVPFLWFVPLGKTDKRARGGKGA